MMMFSLAIITAFAILTVTSAFPTSLTARALQSCPVNALSCSSTAGGSCCSPTNGLILLVQKWYEGLGPENSFKIGGLWSGPSNANDILWAREWAKHGTCLSTLDPRCYANYEQYQEVYEYFSTTLRLYKQYDLYNILSNAGITPGHSYTLGNFESAIQEELGVRPMINCKGSKLEEIRIYFRVRNGNEYVPTNSVHRSNCHGRINFFHKH